MKLCVCVCVCVYASVGEGIGRVAAIDTDVFTKVVFVVRDAGEGAVAAGGFVLCGCVGVWVCGCDMRMMGIEGCV